MPRFYEDFEVGQTYDLKPRLVTAEEIIAFAREYDPQPFHLSEAVAKRSLLGGLAASGWHGAALFMRMSYDSWMKDAGTVLGGPGVDSMRWIKPIRAGDTITGTTEILEMRESKSKPEVGIIRMKSQIRSQTSGELLMELIYPVLIRRRGVAA